MEGEGRRKTIERMNEKEERRKKKKKENQIKEERGQLAVGVKKLLLLAVPVREEVRCSFYEFSKPIRFCSNLVETFFNPFPIRKCKKIGGHHVGFQDGADQSSLDYTRIFAQVFFY